MGNPVVHWEIAGKDGKKIQDFYGKLFDWEIKVDTSLGNYGMVDTGGQGINGGLMASPEGVPPYVTIYVQVDDLQAYLDKAEKLGGKTLVPPTPIPNVGDFAMFSDPEGNCIGIFKE